MGDLVWYDVSKLVEDKRMIGLADQLYRAVGSVGANIAEGYSRQSGWNDEGTSARVAV